jgi:hypothetical protein
MLHLRFVTRDIMVIETDKLTKENIRTLVDKSQSPPRKTLGDIYGKLKRGIDGLEYQKSVRNEWS